MALRNVRRDGVDAAKKLEKAGDIGEDNLKSYFTPTLTSSRDHHCHTFNAQPISIYYNLTPSI